MRDKMSRPSSSRPRPWLHDGPEPAIIGRQDRAWYAVGEAKRRLKEQGWSDDQIYKLDGDWQEFTPADSISARKTVP